MKVHRKCRRVAAVVLSSLFLGTAGIAQPPAVPNPLADAMARQQIANQRAEADVTEALREADRLAKTNPAKAVQVLKSAQSGIDLSAAISQSTRQNLTTRLQTRIVAIQTGKPATGPALDPTRTTVKIDKQADRDAYLAELKAVNEGIDRVSKFQAANRTADAQREIDTLAARYPNNPAVIVLTQKDDLRARLDDARAFSRLQDQRVTLALNDVTRSSIPLKGDVEFPPDWKDKAGKRTSINEYKLSAKEKAVISALEKPVTVNFNNTLLEEALQQLSNDLNEPLIVDSKSLTDLGIDLKKPVSFQARGVSARTVLRQILGSQGLTFVVREETIQVVTVERARDMLATRVYYLGEVVQGVGPFGGSLTWGPYLDYQQTMANVNVIMDSIQSSIDPLSWKKNGGPCSITFHYPSMSIIVRASTEVHATLGSKMSPGK